jgi:hypothetical protein
VSLRTIIAALGANAFQFVGFAGHNELSDGVPIHANALAGDYCAVMYFDADTLSGGAGTAWDTTVILNSTAKLSHRRLEPGDFATPLLVSANGPVITAVWRGIQSISASRTSVSYTGGSSSMAGFVKSANAVGLIGLGWNANDSGNFSLGVPPFQSVNQQGPGNYQFVFYENHDRSLYVDNDLFVVNGVISDAKAAAVFELLV